MTLRPIRRALLSVSDKTGLVELGRTFRTTVPLTVTPIADTTRFAPLRFDYAISMGVRKGDHARRDTLNGIIAAHRSDIEALLARYGVPLLPLPVTPAAAR